jgi:signal transduction histidine kinase
MSGPSLNDPNRLAALRATGLLDSPPEEVFERFTRLATKLLGCPVSLVSLVDEDRQFFKSSRGLDVDVTERRETPLSHSFCQYVVNRGQPLVVPDAGADPMLRENLAVTELGVQSYLGVPVRSEDGFVLGSFCVIDAKVRKWSAEDLSLLEDLGHAVSAEIQLRERTSAMDRLLEEQQEKETEQEKLTHLLVHDLRSPLSAVKAGLELLALQLPESAAEERELLDLAQTGADELLQLINQILEIYRMRSGRLELKPEPLHLNELLRPIFLQMRPAFETAGQNFSVQYAAEDVRFFADRSLIRRVIFNLLSNAHKYSGPGSRVVLRGWTEAGKVGLCVEDNGPGISAQHRESVFEFFGQGDTRLHAAQSSFGLGLAFCRMVADAHQGSLELGTPASAGCSFTLTLPITDG